MYYIRKHPARVSPEKRRDRSETAWAVAAVTLFGLLAGAVVAACYPIWFLNQWATGPSVSVPSQSRWFWGSRSRWSQAGSAPDRRTTNGARKRAGRAITGPRYVDAKSQSCDEISEEARQEAETEATGEDKDISGSDNIKIVRRGRDPLSRKSRVESLA